MREGRPFPKTGVHPRLRGGGLFRDHAPTAQMGGAMVFIRLAKIAIIGSLAAFAFIVAYDNVVDYGSNYEFVRHVLSMDTTFPGNALMHRAIADESIWRVAYALIIATEGLTALLLALGAVMLLGRVSAPARDFNHAKVWAVAGLTVGFALWFVGFMVIAGEYFAMWQSKEWNGEEAAFRIATVILAALIFVSLPDRDAA
jgi:predicted small integral membrane protein